MSDPLLRELDHYVVLEPAGREQILTAQDTLAWLVGHLDALDQVPADLAGLATPLQRAQRLLETACELELEPGELSEELRARRVFLLEGLLFLALEALEPLEGLELTSSTEEKDER